ncbi:MAG TPA: GNAT family N-acetyltransferase, partial [Gemmataceae bacterium]
MEQPVDATPYSPECEADWDRFVEQSRNGNIFHTRRFLSYHPPGRFEDASLMLRRGGRLVGVFPAAWREEPGLGRVLVSHPGASHGGPVFGPKVSAATVHAAVAAILRHAREAGAAAVQLRPAPHLFHQPAMEELDFALHFHGFEVARAELTTYVALDPGAGDLLGTYATGCRGAVRKALKSGLEAGESDDFAGFWGILTEHLGQRHGVRPTHSLEEILTLRRVLPGRIRLFAAARGGELLGGTVVFVCTPRAAHTFYMASRREAWALSPMNLAVHAALEWARGQGIGRVNFGVSTPDRQTVNWGLLDFKESFGGRGACRLTYR